ncbi:hypothetical protein [Sorangium sp. So ce1182]|uniref:hypothetical protein n=1 Tax=Sorangium sp. So ce1182 TaxID=3133334 RepID=UPI003F62797F
MRLAAAPPGSPAGDEDLQMLAGPYALKFLTSTLVAFMSTVDWMMREDELLTCSSSLDAL